MTGRRTLWSAVLVVAVISLAACGSSGAKTDNSTPSSGSPTASTGSQTASTSAASGSNVQKHAQAELAKVTRAPASWPAPSKPVTVKKGSAAIIACAFSAPICKTNGNQSKDALQAAGWSADLYDGQFQAAVVNGLIDKAVQQKRDAIIFIIWDVNTVSAAVDRAAAAGIKMSCVICHSGAQWKGKVYDATINFVAAGEQLGWAILARSGGKANVVLYSDGTFPISGEQAQGVENTIKKNCSTCKTTRKPFGAANLAQPGPPEIKALIASKAKGTITDVVPDYAQFAIVASKTLHEAGRTELGVFTFGSGSDVAAAIKTQLPPMTADSGNPETYASWVAADLVIRLHSGDTALWAGYDQLPTIVVDSSNIAANANAEPLPSGDWQGTFKKLWVVA